MDLQPSHLEDNDIIGDAYEYLIERFASDAGKKAGEFYTPSQASTL
ncbi:MAG: N-6 DNA methylase [Bacteroidia bacterium]